MIVKLNSLSQYCYSVFSEWWIFSYGIIELFVCEPELQSVIEAAKSKGMIFVLTMEDHSSNVCLNESMDEIHSFLDMEIEALQSIYINELKVKNDEKFTTVSIDLHPSTADKLDEQYVRMTLQFTLEEEYPEKIPDIKIRNPRGLSEEKLSFIVKDLLTIAENKKGNSMLFEMIDAAKEHLTIGNRPSGECAICLYGFSENDVFTKTECYHYFHTHCLARYTKNFIENSTDIETDPKSKSVSNELLCPMCRIPINFTGSDRDYPPPEESSENNFVLTEEIVEMQKKMADLFKMQVEKGGIIDIEAEKNKYLLEISNVPTRTHNEENSEQTVVAEGESEAESKVESSNQVDSPTHDVKENVKERYQRHDYRGKNRNYDNKHGDNRSNNRYDQKYNRHSYDNSRSSYNRNKPVRNNQISSRDWSEESNIPPEAGKDISTSPDASQSKDVSVSQDFHDNASETSDQPSDVRSKRNSNSPRYNRGYRRGNSYGNHDRNNFSNYTSHSGHRRSDKSNFYESQNPQVSHRYSSNRNPELYTGESEGRGEKDQRTFDDGGESRRHNYRSHGYKNNDDFNSRERYMDNRNSHRGAKGAYSKRDNYSNASNNYARNRYSDRDQYQTERENFRGRRNYYRDNRPRGGDDKSYYDGHNKQSSRNYSGNRRGRYTDRSQTDSSNREGNESVISTQNQHSDSNTFNVPSGEQECSSKKFNSSERVNKSLQNKESDFGDKYSDKLPEAKTAQDGTAMNVFPNVFNDNSQVKTRTVNPPPGFANPLKKVIYGLQGANPPPGFNRS